MGAHRRAVPVCLTLLAFLAVSWLPLAGSQGSEGGRGIGVSPSRLEYGSVLRAEPTVQFIEVQNGMNATAELTVQREGQLAEWVRLPNETIRIPPQTRQQVPFTLEVPSDTPNGFYDANITVSVRPDEPADPTHVGVQVGVTVRLNATVGGAQIVALEAGRFSVSDIEEKNPLPFSFWARNRGNVRVAPTVDAEVLDAAGRVLHRETLPGPQIRAGVEEQVTLHATPDLRPGQYWLRAIVRAGGEIVMNQTLTFDVLVEGELRRQGEIGSIFTTDFQTRARNHRLPVNTAFIIVVPFTNTGQVGVDAHFEGFVSKGGTIVSELRTNPLRVEAGDNATLEMVVPGLAEPGAYSIRGKVYYSGKVTGESEWILTLEGAASRGKPRTPGFEAAFAIAGLCGVALLLGAAKRRA